MKKQTTSKNNKGKYKQSNSETVQGVKTCKGSHSGEGEVHAKAAAAKHQTLLQKEGKGCSNVAEDNRKGKEQDDEEEDNKEDRDEDENKDKKGVDGNNVASRSAANPIEVFGSLAEVSNKRDYDWELWLLGIPTNVAAFHKILGKHSGVNLCKFSILLLDCVGVTSKDHKVT